LASGMRRPYREVGMDGWWWIPIVLVAWLAVATVLALWLGPVLRSWSLAREALDQETAGMLARPRRPLRHWRQAS
jgi:hypothetical protein